MSRNRHFHYTKRIRKLLWAAVLFLTLHAATFICMPLAANSAAITSSKGAFIALGLSFWLSAIIGYVLLITANYYRREFVKKRLNGDNTMGCRIGILNFFSTTPGKIVDGLFLVALLSIIIVYLVGSINKPIAYTFLALLSFSANMHGVFNGRIYKTSKLKRSVRRDNNE